MIEPDTKDWTWVLQERCPDCGFDAAAVDPARLGEQIRDSARGFVAVLGQPGATERPDDSTWSPLEYACHVRDVNRKFTERLGQMLEEDEPHFANWDQDATALEGRYDQQDPAVVGPELLEAAETVAQMYDDVAGADDETRSRRGYRSDGAAFTVDTLGRYHLHDLVHHAHDVRDFAVRATVAAYDVDAEPFSEAVAQLNDGTRRDLDSFAAVVGSGGAVLEIGAGGGRDALAMAERGLVVRPTDISPGFVELMRGRGLDADVVDPLHDDLGGPYDGIWASACLLHVAREDLRIVLSRLAAATRAGGVLCISLKEGDGEEWSVHGHVRAPRRFVYWREAPLRAVLAGAGWRVQEVLHDVGANGQAWLTTRAVRF